MYRNFWSIVSTEPCSRFCLHLVDYHEGGFANLVHENVQAAILAVPRPHPKSYVSKLLVPSSRGSGIVEC
jgi:hypothetical protein